MMIRRLKVKNKVGVFGLFTLKRDEDTPRRTHSCCTGWRKWVAKKRLTWLQLVPPLHSIEPQQTQFPGTHAMDRRKWLNTSLDCILGSQLVTNTMHIQLPNREMQMSTPVAITQQSLQMYSYAFVNETFTDLTPEIYWLACVCICQLFSNPDLPPDSGMKLFPHGTYIRQGCHAQ